MNRLTPGFTLLELLVTMTVLLLLLGGFCCLLLVLPKTTLYQADTAMELHKCADFWLALQKDVYHAGYGITDTFPLLTFKAIVIENNKCSTGFRLHSYWNKFHQTRRTLNKVYLPRGKIVIMSIDMIQKGDYAILAENDQETAMPRWALVAIKKIENESEYIMNVYFELLEEGPSGADTFAPSAYFVPVEKISYVFHQEKGEIVRMVNDTAIQPFLENVQESCCEFCYHRKEKYLRNCIECSIAFKGKLLPHRYSTMLYIPNL